MGSKKSTKVKCDECGKEVSDGALSRHKASLHSTERPFVCPFPDCKRSTAGWARNDALKFHLKHVHTGQAIPVAGVSVQTSSTIIDDEQTSSEDAASMSASAGFSQTQFPGHSYPNPSISAWATVAGEASTGRDSSQPVFPTYPQPTPYSAANDYLLTREYVAPFSARQDATTAKIEQLLDPALFMSPSGRQRLGIAPPVWPAQSSTPAGRPSYPTHEYAFADNRSSTLHSGSSFDQGGGYAWRCEYPGCKEADQPFYSNPTYRHHMNSMHGVDVAPNKMWKRAEHDEQSTTNGWTERGHAQHAAVVGNMDAYMYGVGLPQIFRKRKGAGDEQENLPANPPEESRTENMGLPARESCPLLEELEPGKTRSLAGPRQTKKRWRELDEKYRITHEKLKAASNDEVVRAHADELKALWDRRRMEYDEEMKAEQHKHRGNEALLRKFFEEGKK